MTEFCTQWTSERELAWLSEQAQDKQLVLEIGTCMGHSAAAIARALPADGQLICVDIFADPRISYEGCVANLREFIDAGKLKLFKMDAAEAAHLGLRFDMIWIDDGHTYEDVKRDIATARLLATPGALVCGHDFMGEVEQAVREEFPHVQVAVDSIWCVTL
jgi:predicted O-methyltransferase YrrM